MLHASLDSNMTVYLIINLGLSRINQLDDQPVMIGLSFNQPTSTINIEWLQPKQAQHAYNIFISSCSYNDYYNRTTISGSCSCAQVNSSHFVGVVLIAVKSCHNDSHCINQSLTGFTTQSSITINFTRTGQLVIFHESMIL